MIADCFVTRLDHDRIIEFRQKGGKCRLLHWLCVVVMFMICVIRVLDEVVRAWGIGFQFKSDCPGVLSIAYSLMCCLNRFESS